MATMVINKPVKLAQLLRSHRVLSTKDLYSTMARLNGQSKLDQATVLLDVLRNKIASNSELIKYLKKALENSQDLLKDRMGTPG